MTNLNVNEIFYTIQGEGPNTGTPAIFLRLSGCNLRCYWCDTTYTWLFSQSMADSIRQRLPMELQMYPLDVYQRDDESHHLNLDQIQQKISEYPGTHVVVSGGEPLLQKESLIPLLSELLRSDYSIEIETNGTIDAKGLPGGIRFNVSIKLQNSFNEISNRLVPHAIEDLLSRDSIFKFVIDSKEDLKEVEELIEQYQIPRSRVYLMPQGKTTEELRTKSVWIIAICKARNYNYSHRLHVDIFDKKRGV